MGQNVSWRKRDHATNIGIQSFFFDIFSISFVYSALFSISFSSALYVIVPFAYCARYLPSHSHWDIYVLVFALDVHTVKCSRDNKTCKMNRKK